MKILLAYPSKLRNLNGKSLKNTDEVFTVGPVTTPPGQLFAVFQVQRFLRMFWKKKISKNLGHQDHTQTEEMASPQFLQIVEGNFFRAAS